MDSRTVGSILAEIAETVGETIDLQQVFDRVAASVRRVIPFDDMGVVRVVDGDRAVLHAATMVCATEPARCSPPTPLTEWSPRVRPRPGPIERIDDATTQLDPAYPMDAATIESGVRSALWEPFRSGDQFRGGVWLAALRPGAFNAEHQEILRPIAALLGSGIEHWKIWDAERVRRERLDRLEAIAVPLSESLDVRDVFGRISEAVQPVLPHDALILISVDEQDPSRVRLEAVAGGEGVPTPRSPIRLTDAELRLRERDFDIGRDIPSELGPDSDRSRALLATGMRSWLRVPVTWGGVRWSVAFLHREPARYGPEDVEVARRIADRIALALSYERLAEEARVAAEASERAQRLQADVERLQRELASRGSGQIVGVSKAWDDVLGHVARVAPSETTVLITGESGTGKEVVARLIHQGSPRARAPFVAINCAALPEQLLESELFGHEKGAFTGAVAARIGRIEQAAGGTLFLDEIGEMSPLVQAKLLRVLQEREFQRLGGNRTLRADVRVLAATNQDLSGAIERGRFREDLYYRLQVFEIGVPPLRERPEDILPLARQFVDELGRSMGRPAAGLSTDGSRWLRSYPWPGNVRELRNAIERAILLCDGGLITREHLPAVVVRPVDDLPAPAAGRPGVVRLPQGGVDLAALDRRYVEEALRRSKGNKSQAARLLGLSRSQLYSRLEKYRIP